MTQKANEIEKAMISMGDEAQAKHLMRFFKCAPGQYGHGDKFLGIKVPQTRSLVKECKSLVSFEDAVALTKSQWHEVRLAGFLFLIEFYKKAKKSKDIKEIDRIITKYLSLIQYGSNWDLVDLVAPKLLGDYLVTNPDQRIILDNFSEREDSLWHQRVAIVATWTLICNGIFEDTLRISKKYLAHSHDLIHKATGWMLREMGKRGGEKELRDFLDINAPKMPRTMLRYAIERLPASDRQHYLNLPRQ